MKFIIMINRFGVGLIHVLIDSCHHAPCSSIQALLSAPNPDDPLSENIAKHWKSNEAEAVETGMLQISI